MLPIKWFGQYAIPYQHRQLIMQLTKRNILQRFKGSMLGVAWVFITPIIMLTVYTFVFKTVLKAKWPGTEPTNNIEFALQIFSGLLVFNLFAEVLSRSASMITEQPNMVKKVIFPLPILAWVNVLSAMFFALVNALVFVIGALLMGGAMTPHLIMIPMLFIMCLPMLLGLTWGISALGVYLRDLAQLITLLLTPLMFLSPIFYPVEALPEMLQSLMVLNPLVQPIELLRDSVIESVWPHGGLLIAYLVVACIIMLLGAAGFHKLKKGFADVL